MISLDDEMQTVQWKGMVSRLKSSLAKIIKDVSSRFDDYSISPLVRQIL